MFPDNGCDSWHSYNKPHAQCSSTRSYGNNDDDASWSSEYGDTEMEDDNMNEPEDPSGEAYRAYHHHVSQTSEFGAFFNANFGPGAMNEVKPEN